MCHMARHACSLVQPVISAQSYQVLQLYMPNPTQSYLLLGQPVMAVSFGEHGAASREYDDLVTPRHLPLRIIKGRLLHLYKVRR